MSISRVMKAAVMAAKAHEGQKDRAGNDYILHPLTVAWDLAERGAPDSAVIAALLHDAAEDTDLTLEDIKGSLSGEESMSHKEYADFGECDDIIEALKLLTHDEAMPYMEYVDNLKENEIARAVKMADLRHNMDLSRLPEVTEKDRKRLDKYKKAYEILEKFKNKV